MQCDVEIKNAIQKLYACNLIEGAQRISTTCLYPDGGRIVVFVYHGYAGEGYIVSDDGDAYETLRSYGIDTKNKFTKRAKETADLYGLIFDEKTGHFKSESETVDKIPSAITYMANCIQKFVQTTVSKRQMDSETDLSNRIDECLYSFKSIPKRNIIKEYTLTGHSGKKHNFSHAIIHNNKNILISPVSNHHASIAPAYLKFNDITKEHSDYKREAVISNAESWESSNITLLNGVVDNLNCIEDGLVPLMNRYNYA